MIVLPEELNQMIKAIEQAGYEAYAVGGGVRDTLMGRRPNDWDIASSAPAGVLMGLFPGSSTMGEKYGVVRIGCGALMADAATFRIDGHYADFRRPERVVFTDQIEEDLKRRDFTVNAIALNPDRGVVDPFDGMGDIERKRIKTVGEPWIRLAEDPLRIMRAVRFTAQLDFDLEEHTKDAMRGNVSLLKRISRERILEEFIKLITAEHCGKGLEYAMETGMLSLLLGFDIEKALLEQLIEHVDQTLPLAEYRLALLYGCLPKTMALHAMEEMGFPGHLHKKLKDAISVFDEFKTIRDASDLKKMIYKFGYENSRYFIQLLAQTEILEVVPYSKEPLSQKYSGFLRDIESRNEPVLLEDLATDGKELMRIGVKEGKVIGEMLRWLLDIVHQNPSMNTKEILLEQVKHYKGQ